MYRLLMLLLLFPAVAYAQFVESGSSSIRSLQMIVNGNSENPPVIMLGSDDEISLSFDEMSHTYHRYIYRITHCNADWSASELFAIDYLDGFNNQTIDDWQNSENTTQLYTNYRITLPNDYLSFKVSGNYKVEIIDDEADDEEPVAVFAFVVAEQRVSIHAKVSGDTEVDLNDTHQQVSFLIDYSRYKITAPAVDVKVRVFQNRRLDNFVDNLKPTYITANNLEYVHERKLIFDAGNEYRRFEVTDPNSPGMGVERISFHYPYYHVDLYADTPNSTHTNYRDENGRFFINTQEGYGTEIEADYVLVHFRLEAPYRSDGHYYLLGDCWGNRFSDSNIMVYDNSEGAYLTTQLMKLGVYNYQYVWVPDDSRRAYTYPVEGDFYNTENEYLILFYHREFGARYDRLVGVRQISCK